MDRKARRFLKRRAGSVMHRAKTEYVPVGSGPSGGSLRDSGRVHEIQVDPSGWSVLLSFGGTPESRHAAAVHEHVGLGSQYSPPSWQGKEIHFDIGGPKYLEWPLMEEAFTFLLDASSELAL